MEEAGQSASICCKGKLSETISWVGVTTRPSTTSVIRCVSPPVDCVSFANASSIVIAGMPCSQRCSYISCPRAYTYMAVMPNPPRAATTSSTPQANDNSNRIHSLPRRPLQTCLQGVEESNSSYGLSYSPCCAQFASDCVSGRPFSPGGKCFQMITWFCLRW